MTNKKSRLYLLVINDNKFYANLLIINRGEYDVILGMDELSIFHAVIDCRRIKVIFQISNRSKFEFVSGS